MSKKNVSIICQAKGGVGKTFITGMLIHKHIVDENPISLVLLDSSQKANQNKERFSKLVPDVKVWDIYNTSNEYKRSHFFEVFGSITKLPTNDVICDFGAPESSIFREALESDRELTPENLLEISNDLGIELTFNVVVSGADDNVSENIDYFNSLNKQLGDFFKVNCLINDYTFKSDDSSRILAEKLADLEIAKPEQIRIVGYTGNRINDNGYIVLIQLMNCDLTYLEAIQNIPAKIRLRNMFQQLNGL
jgi:hypothetical protein